MIDFTCMRAESWIDRRVSGLSSADALRLEEHLSSCERCSRQAALLDRLRALATSDDVVLSTTAREVVINRALRQAQAAAPRPAGLRMLPVGAALAVAAAAVALLLLRDEAVSPSSPAERAAVQRAASPAITEPGELRAELQAQTFALAHAKVTLGPRSSARWNAGSRELSLTSGDVQVEVDPRPKQSFAVITERFSVQVLGTRFSVSQDHVSVERGRVRVQGVDGRELAVLGAGERFDWSESEHARADEAAAQEAVEPESAQKSPSRVHPAPREHGAARLAEARALLASRQVARARKALDQALAQKLSPAEKAEAMSLRADCALVEGDQAGAVEAYLRVARAFAGQHAGENALFSAARLEMERGRSASAAQWLTRYLERYPQGRFVKEARVRLRELNEVLDHAP